MHSLVSVLADTARRLHRLVEPIHLVTYFAERAQRGADGARSRATTGTATSPAGPRRWAGSRPRWCTRSSTTSPTARSPATSRASGTSTTPEAALAARERGSAAALRRILGDLADTPRLARAADLATKAATGAPTEGRALYAGLRTLTVPDEPVARLWHAATLLREHRGDGHIAALVAAGHRRD